MPSHALAAPVFALTKIQPPRLRTRLIARARLEQRLAQALASLPLVLISAPAGFGKTAALTRLVENLPPGTALAWVAADEDDELGRLAACLIAALEPFDLPWRTSPDALVAMQAGDRAARQALTTELLNALAATEVPRGLIVLDDVHRISDPAVFDWLDQLVERLPPHWGLLMAGRVDPPLALARLRARGELAEFRQHDLRFSGDEVAELLQQRLAAQAEAEADGGAGRAEPWRQQAQALLDRTQGWPAGVNLALAHGGGRRAAAPGGSLRERQVFDYLSAEVLDELPAELRDFLLRCAVLPELSASRCAALLEQSPAQAARLLEQIERRGLFVSVRGDSAGEPGGDPAAEPALWLHDLFRDFLLQRLRSERPEQWPRLLRRAADTEPDLIRRLGYLARAADWPAAEDLLVAQGPALLARGAVQPLLRLIDQLPAALREASPRLAQLSGLCAWAHWDLVTMCQHLTRAAAGHAQRGDMVAAQRAQALMVLGLAAGGQVPQAAALLARLPEPSVDAYTAVTTWQARAWQALADSRLDAVAAPLARMMDLLEPCDDDALWLQAVPLTSFVGLPGTRATIQRYIDAVLRRTPDEPPTTLRVLAQALQAGLWLWDGQAEAAAALLVRVDADRRWLGRPPNLSGYYHLFLGLTQAVLGRRDAALAAAQARLDGLDDERTSGRREVWLRHFLFAKLRLAVMLDDGQTLREIAAVLGTPAAAAEVPFFVRERATLPGHLAAFDGRWDEACTHYARALDDELALELYGQAMETRLRLAQARIMLGQRAVAAAVLRPVFERTAAGGEIGPVLMAGPRALALLASTPWGDLMPADAVRQLGRWSQQLQALRGVALQAESAPGSLPAAPATLAGLSSREVEVLARIAAGDSNKLIARAFDLSPHTVKRHVANIFDKLSLSSRGQAAAWYRALPR